MGKYYCKQSFFVYLACAVVLIIPLMMELLYSFRSIDYEYVAVYLYLSCLLFGVVFFSMKTLCVEIDENNLVFRFFGVPVKTVSIRSIIELKEADKTRINLFALSSKQIAIRSDKDSTVNVALRDNESFAKVLRGFLMDKNVPRGRFKQTTADGFILIRVVLAAIYIFVNGVLCTGLMDAWFYRVLPMLMLCVANIFCLALYDGTYRNQKSSVSS